MSLYYLTYEVTHHPEGLTREQIPEGHAACDNLLLVSIILPEDGSYSQQFTGTRGRTEDEMEPSEYFKTWIMMAHSLGTMEGLSPEKRELAQALWEIFAAAMFGAKGKDDEKAV